MNPYNASILYLKLYIKTGVRSCISTPHYLATARTRFHIGNRFPVPQKQASGWGKQIPPNLDKQFTPLAIFGDPILYADVMNKQEAAEFEGVSVRALERYVQQGRIGGRYEKGKTRPTLVFDKAELESFKAELEQKIYKPVVESSNPDNADSNDKALTRLSENSATQPSSPDFEALSVVLEALKERQSQQVSVPPHHKLLLNLTDAQALTGLSRAFLREAINKGTLKAEVIGRSWRIKRTDLETYVKKLF